MAVFSETSNLPLKFSTGADLYLFFTMEQLKDLFAGVPFTDRDRVSEILQDEGVSLA